MTLLNALNEDDMAIVNNSLETVTFSTGTCIMEQGGEGNGCYFIDEGTVRVEYDTGELDTDVVLNYLEPGMVMGDFSLIDHEPRSASLYAHTDVTARWLSLEKFETLLANHPKIGTQLLKTFSANLIQIVRQANKQLADFISMEVSTPFVDSMIENAHAAQTTFQDWPEDKVDALLNDMVDAIVTHADELAADTVEESGLGVMADKVAKIRFASQGVYDVLAGKPAYGMIQYNQADRIEEIASPMGVIMGIIPLTNPVPTMIFKALICLKSRNALIMSCHRKAMIVGNKTGEILQDVLKKHHAPVHLIQWIRERSSRKLTNMFMRHPDMSFILATGGPSIVRAAYSSGTPAIGVGAGNAPVYIAQDADIEKTAEMNISSKSFDNGVICGSENNLVVDASVHDAFLTALKKHGARILNQDEMELLLEEMYDSDMHRFNAFMVGHSAQAIAEKAGIAVDDTMRLLILPLENEQYTGPFGHEKLAPVLSLFTVKNEEEAFKLCKDILTQEGSGHTAIIHTHDQDLAKRYAALMPASRILTNVGGSLGCIGGGNGLLPSLTLGCGTLGGTSTTDNVTYKNLLNVKRLAFAL
ncbi:aldehyde dehydrogenase family protein [candidate division KSB1 bacterium]|nr:aldehyde dehydrogenase family protein [candidate division KSB1 bacterium]